MINRAAGILHDPRTPDEPDDGPPGCECGKGADEHCTRAACVDGPRCNKTHHCTTDGCEWPHGALCARHG